MTAVKPALKIATFIMLIWGCLMGLTVLLADWSTAQEVRAMVLSALVCLGVAVACMRLSRGPLVRMKAKPMFLVTAVNWGLLCLTGALPLYLGWPELSFIDALFESVSGVTTTGSTILVGLDDGPRTLILWRSLMQWVGGIGIILMAVAVLPFLKVGGMRLFKTESSEWSNIQNTRVRRILASRTGTREGPADAAYSDARLTINPDRHELTLDGQTISLTRKEWAVMQHLVQAPGRLVTQTSLLEKIWGRSHKDDSQYLRNVIRQLRIKLGDDAANPDYLETEPGIGYRFLDRR